MSSSAEEEIFMNVRSTKSSYIFNEKLLSGFEIQDWNLKTLAKEIYENIGQLLSLAKLQIATLNPDKKEELKKVVDSSDHLLEKAIKDLRKLTKLLTPSEIMHKGFAAALHSESEKLNKATLWKIDLHIEGHPFRLEETRELILFSILQHYIMKALYVEEVGKISVAILYKVNFINIRISYIENEKTGLVIRRSKGVGIYRRAKMISASILLKRKLMEKIIRIKVKK